MCLFYFFFFGVTCNYSEKLKQRVCRLQNASRIFLSVGKKPAYQRKRGHASAGQRRWERGGGLDTDAKDIRKTPERESLPFTKRLVLRQTSLEAG